MEIIDILKISIPAFIVLLTAYILIDRMLRNEDKRRTFEINKNNQSLITPIRLRAF